MEVFGRRPRARGWALVPVASLFVALALGGAFGACGPPPGELPLRLSPASEAALDGRGSEAETLRALLHDAFGNMLDPTWPAVPVEGLDPSLPALGRLEPALVEQIRRDNAVRHGEFLERLEQGDVPRRPPRGLDHLAPLLEEARARPEARAALREAVLDFQPSGAEVGRMYARFCFACHGREGGGDGPTAPSLNPRPRDLRAGTFAHHPSRAPLPSQMELVEILRRGVPGTGMTAFRGMTAGEKSALVDQVRRLAVRGEVERRLVEELLAGRRLDAARVAAHTAAALEPWAERQADAKGSESPSPSAPQRP